MNATNDKNRLAVAQLRLLDFPIESIRKALSKLTGIEHSEIARGLGVSRQTVTLHLCGYRHNPKVQQGIADALNIPVEDIFERQQEAA